MGFILKICGVISCLAGIVLSITVIGLAAGIPVFISGVMLYALGDINDRTKGIEESLDSLIRYENKKIEEEKRIAEAKKIEEENKKSCPKCAGKIQREARVCPLCGYEYRIIHTLTVYKPDDGKQGHLLIKRLMEKTNKAYSEVNESLIKGMVFEYSNEDNLEKNKKAFENFGCSVSVSDILAEN